MTETNDRGYGYTFEKHGADKWYSQSTFSGGDTGKQNQLVPVLLGGDSKKRVFFTLGASSFGFLYDPHLN